VFFNAFLDFFRQLYRVEDVPDVYNPVCLTCELAMPKSGESCSYGSFSLSPDLSYYVHGCSGPSFPEYVVRQTDTGDVVSFLEDNTELAEKLANKAEPSEEQFEVDLPGKTLAVLRILS